MEELLKEQEEELQRMSPMIVQRLVDPCNNCKKFYSFLDSIVEDISNSIDLQSMAGKYIKIDGQASLKGKPLVMEKQSLHGMYETIAKHLKRKGISNFGLDLINQIGSNEYFIIDLNSLSFMFGEKQKDEEILHYREALESVFDN